MNLLSFLHPITIAVYNSKYNGEIKIIENFGSKIVYVKGAQQSGGDIYLMWQKVTRNLMSEKPVIKNALIMGLGGGTVVKLLSGTYPQINSLAIDIDPVMIEIAKKHFGLDKIKNIEFITADVIAWLKSNKNIKFDLIVIDLYIGFLNPDTTREKNFLVDIRKLLQSDGIVLYNCHYRLGHQVEYGRFIALCRKIFQTVKETFTYPYNRVLLLKP